MSYSPKTSGHCLIILLSPLLCTAALADRQRDYPNEVYWGDTHVHTYLSQDAYVGGARVTPDEAYRFAKGETVQSSGGRQARLQRPLDFLLVADHAENLGVMPRLANGDTAIPDSAARRQWEDDIAALPEIADRVAAETLDEFLRIGEAMVTKRPAGIADYQLDESLVRSIWEEVVAVAERHNEPGEFTTFVGFEWTAVDGDSKPNMIHRNVLFADGPEVTKQVVPFSRFDSDNVEDLWKYLQDYEARLGGNVLAIPHNANLSGGKTFRLQSQSGEAFTKSYAATRARWEPIVEVTQLKGDGETHPSLSPDDEFADFESWPPPPGSYLLAEAAEAAEVKATGKPSKKKAKSEKKGMTAGAERGSYARTALQRGLAQQSELGINPFKFGMIGSTDSHTGLAGVEEDWFWGGSEPSRYRALNRWFYSSAGYAAVWATENTREALFAAMKRRETYATTGPRMVVRFFGGWEFEPADADQADFVENAYAHGVPMGGDLTHAPGDKRPRFIVAASKDPQGANLDRVQIVKGWRACDGKLEEKVFDVALAENRTDGATELTAVWEDPGFDADELAFYYVRVLQVPTPRWTAYDVERFELQDLPKHIPMETRERAYTSPIWYTP